MRHAISLLSLLLLLPHLAGAQESQAGSRTHTVAPGETLGAIAQRYLGSAGEWRRIADANSDRIPNPNVIRVGMELVIPGGGAAPVANVLGFQSGGTVVESSILGSYSDRRASLEYGTFGTSVAAEVPLNARTIFYEEGNVNSVGAVIVPRLEDVPALQESSFHAASWLIPNTDPSHRLGEVVGLAIAGTRPSAATLLFPGDEVQIRLDAGTVPEVGEEFLAYSVPRQIPEVGAIAVPTGRLRVTGSSGDLTTASIVAMYDPMRIGDSLARLQAFPLTAGVHPASTSSGSEARIVAFEYTQEIYLPGDVAFLDRGSDAGVSLGDEMVAIVDGSASPDAGVARFQVVRVAPAGATVRVTAVRTTLPLRPGLVLTTDRKMP